MQFDLCDTAVLDAQHREQALRSFVVEIGGLEQVLRDRVACRTIENLGGGDVGDRVGKVGDLGSIALSSRGNGANGHGRGEERSVVQVPSSTHVIGECGPVEVWQTGDQQGCALLLGGGAS